MAVVAGSLFYHMLRGISEHYPIIW